MNKTPILATLALTVALTGCQFDLSNLLSDMTLTCTDIQAQADDCYAHAETEEASTACDEQQFEASSCSFSSVTEAQDASVYTTGDEGDTGDACADLADLLELCEEGAVDTADCVVFEEDLAACLEG